MSSADEDRPIDMYYVSGAYNLVLSKRSVDDYLLGPGDWEVVITRGSAAGRVYFWLLGADVDEQHDGKIEVLTSDGPKLVFRNASQIGQTAFVQAGDEDVEFSVRRVDHVFGA